MFNEVIVPLDGSDESARALRPASAIARYLDLTMRVVAYHPPKKGGEELTKVVCAQVDTIGVVKRMICVEPTDSPVEDALVDLVGEHPGALVVMSSHGYGRSAALVGSVATELLARTGAPVLLIGPECDVARFRLHGPMLVAADGTNYSHEVLDLAASTVDAFDFEPSVVNVLDSKTTQMMRRARAEEDGYEVPPDSATASRLAKDLGTATGIANVDYRVLHDRDPARALVKRSIDTDTTLIVMATRARSGVRRLTLGSVTAAVVSNAPCPVMAVAPG